MPGRSSPTLDGSTSDPSTRTLEGRTVAVTAERRSDEQANLFAKRGATVVRAPTMHTVDLNEDEALRRQTEAVVASPPEWTVATTGYGMRLWFDAAEAWGLGEQLVGALAAGRVVARGPKAQSACRQRGLDVVWSAPGESMPEVLAWLGDQDGIFRDTVVVQLFDPADHPSTAALDRIAGAVVAVPVYRWRLPDDVDAALDLVRRMVDGSVDAVTFTSQPALRFLHEIARSVGLDEAMVAACNDGTVLPVCIGPVCAEAAIEVGITAAVWPDPYRLVPMVKLAEQRLTGRSVGAARAVTFEVVDPRSQEAVAAVGAYFAELDRRFPDGFDAGDALTADADQLDAPGGAFVVARLDGRVVGCGGVRTIGDRVGEIKRMWIDPDQRGHGVGRALLAELEACGRSLDHRLVRLDTNSNLPEAVNLYRRSGYVAIERYNDNPYPDHFFEKRLD